jgi:lipopolysaccharide/colanic/teichoic acid biosynthesis glycosyltransferase
MSLVSHEIQCRDVKFSDGERSAARWTERYKPALESVFAALLLVVLSPLVVLSLVLVRLTSRGRAIYTQRRLGRGGKVFTIYKIRSMYIESECDGPRWSLPGDQRITPIGRILRACHIDELPQLVNVLRGEMSLIGPRPERPEIVSQLERALPGYRRRLVVRPGLSGLAQVLQPPDTDLGSVRRKLNYDLIYIDSVSPWLDLRIALATILHVLAVPGQAIAGLLRLPYGVHTASSADASPSGRAAPQNAG